MESVVVEDNAYWKHWDCSTSAVSDINQWPTNQNLKRL